MTAKIETKKKILIFHQALAPYRVDFWNSFSKHFDTEIHFIYENHLDQHFDQDRLKSFFHLKPNYLKNGFQIGSRAFRSGFLSVIQNFKPDIVFTYEYSQTTWFVYLLKRMFGFRYKIYSVCDDSPDIAKSCRGLRAFSRNYLVKRIDGLILINNEVADWYTNRFKKNNWIVFPITYKEEGFRASLASALERSNAIINENNLIGKKCVFFVGRLVAVKGIDRLITAFSKISAEFPEVVLVLIGTGDQHVELVDLATRLGIQQQVLFAGRHEGNELLAWYNIGQLFVLPSHYEPYGAVVNEALLSGANVLCSNLAGASTLINPNENGDLFDPYDINSLASLLAKELNRIEPIDQLKAIRKSKTPFIFDQLFNSLIEKLNA